MAMVVMMVMVMMEMMVMVMMVMVMMVMVVMVMVMVMVVMVMVMVVEMTIEKSGLIECMQYEKFTSFCNSILHMVILALHSHNTSLNTKTHGRQSQSIVSNGNTILTGRLYLCYGCTEAFPDIPYMVDRVWLPHMGTRKVCGWVPSSRQIPSTIHWEARTFGKWSHRTSNRGGGSCHGLG